MVFTESAHFLFQKNVAKLLENYGRENWILNIIIKFAWNINKEKPFKKIFYFKQFYIPFFFLSIFLLMVISLTFIPTVVCIVNLLENHCMGNHLFISDLLILYVVNFFLFLVSVIKYNFCFSNWKFSVYFIW